MRTITRIIECRTYNDEIIRYVINGLLATAVHYGILTFNLKILNIHSAGLANLFAAFFGISTSFVGSRYFVFKKCDEHIARQAIKFVVLYACIACLHGVVLFFWSDVCKLDYRIGFLFATALQVLVSYAGNKMLVFKP